MRFDAPTLAHELLNFAPARQAYTGQLEPAAGPAQSWYVLLDGRPIPFKFLRAADTPRPVLVLLPGMGVTHGTFAGIAPWLVAQHDLLVLDYNSFYADFGWPTGGPTLREMAVGIWAVIDALGMNQVSFAGSSLGGGLALLATGLQPRRVRQLILFNPAVFPQELPRMYHWMRIPLLGDWMMYLSPPERLVNGLSRIGYSQPEVLPARCRAAFERDMHLANRWKLMDIMRQLPPNARASRFLLQGVADLPHPMLLLWGEQERLLPTDTPERMARLFPGLQTRRFAQLAHLPHDEAPDELGAFCQAFLAAERT